MTLHPSIMMEILKRKLYCRTLRVKPCLKALGLPRGTRWPQAAARLKEFTVQARRNNDDALAAQLSEMGVFLRRNLPNECKCGAAIAAQAISCRACN